jgi:sugar lactone lactonase YvrE
MLTRRLALAATFATALGGAAEAQDRKDDRLKTLLDNGLYFEAPRWHGGRLWLVDARARTLLRLTDKGSPEVVCTFEGVPAGLGFLPDGTPIVTDMHGRALVRSDGGKPVRHVDLSSLTGTIDDMTVDGLGRAWVGDLGFDLKSGIKYGPHGRLILMEPERAPKVVADRLDFPNGIALSGDGRRLVVAETNAGSLACYDVRADGTLVFDRRIASGKTPDGVCFDAEGAMWVALLDDSAFVRLASDGRVLDRIPVPGRRGVACVLGGNDRRTLYCISMETKESAAAGGQPRSFLEATVVDVPGAGWP